MISRKKIIFGSVLIGVVILAVVLYKTSGVSQWMNLDHLVKLIDILKGHPYTPVIFCFVFMLGVLGLPITMFPIVGGILFNFGTALFLNMTGAVLGAWLAFTVARLFGRGVVEKLLQGRLKSLDQSAKQYGFGTMLLLRVIGIPPFIAANYIFGLSTIRQRDYLLATVIGILPWMTIVTYSAHSLWDALLIGGEAGLRHALVKTMGPLLIFSLVILTGLSIQWWIKRRRKAHSNL